MGGGGGLLQVGGGLLQVSDCGYGKNSPTGC